MQAKKNEQNQKIFYHFNCIFINYDLSLCNNNQYLYKRKTKTKKMEANLQEKSDNTKTFESIVESIVERLLDKKFSAKEKELREAAEPKKYYTRKEVCEIYHVSLMTIHNWVTSGKLVQKKIGKRVLFDRDSINEAVKEQSVFRYQHVSK